MVVAPKVRVVSKAYGSDAEACLGKRRRGGLTIEEAQREGYGTDAIPTLKDNTDDDNYDTFLSEFGPEEPHCHKLRALSRADSGVEDARAARRRRRRRTSTPEYEDYTEVETINSMIHLKRKARGHRRGVQRVLTRPTSRLHRPGAHVQHPRRGRAQLRRVAVHPGRARTTCTARLQEGLALYSSNVLIMEKCEGALPDHFNFRAAAVDSQDP